MKKIILSLFFFLGLFFLSSVSADAHVVVTPSQVGVAAFQTFTVGVPTEKDNPTVAVRLVLPPGLDEVTPNMKPGWKITVKKDEIDWTEGSIPPDERDDFSFSAQVPSQETTLTWKAYQTYQDGSVVSWDQEGKSDTPASHTKVVNDIAKSSPQQTPTPWIAYAALALSVIALLRPSFRSKVDSTS